MRLRDASHSNQSCMEAQPKMTHAAGDNEPGGCVTFKWKLHANSAEADLKEAKSSLSPAAPPCLSNRQYSHRANLLCHPA